MRVACNELRSRFQRGRVNNRISGGQAVLTGEFRRAQGQSRVKRHDETIRGEGYYLIRHFFPALAREPLGQFELDKTWNNAFICARQQRIDLRPKHAVDEFLDPG